VQSGFGNFKSDCRFSVSFESDESTSTYGFFGFNLKLDLDSMFLLSFWRSSMYLDPTERYSRTENYGVKMAGKQ
jgi:hypothetical protein